MPVYEVQDPETGVTLELEGDSPPTEGELVAIFDQYRPSPLQQSGEVPYSQEQTAALGPQYAPPAQPERGLGEKIMGGAEAGASMLASGIPGLVGKGVGAAQGMTEYLGQGDFSKPPAELVTQRATEGEQRMTAPFIPPSEAGREYVQDAGEALAPLSGAMMGLAPISTGVGSTLATSAKMAARAPRQTLAAPLPQSMQRAPSTIRTMEGEYIPNIPEGPQPVPKLSPRNAGIREAIRENTVESVGYKIDPVSNKPVANMLERDLVDKFKVNENTILATRQLEGAAKRPAMQMLDIAERYVKGDRNLRPNVVIGDSLMKRFNRVLAANKTAGKKIDEIAGKELAGKRVDAGKAFDSFERELSDMGVQFDGKGRPIFKGSELSGNSVVAPINRVFEWIGDRNRVDALMNREPRSMQDGLKLHRMKRYIDRQIEWGRDPSQPLDKKAVLVLKNLRRNINEELKKVSPDYAQQNAIYSETIEPIGQLTDVLGKRFDPEAPRVNSMVGQELRKTLSNYSVSNDMRTAIDSIDSMAVKHGGVYDDKIMPLVELYSDMEGKLGSFAPNSLQGVGEKVMDQAVTRFGLAGEAAKTAKEAYVRRSNMYETPAAEKLKLIQKLREQIKDQQ